MVQFFRLQIVQHEKWEAAGCAQHTGVVIEPFRRGVFYASCALKTAHPSSPQPLVIDVPKFHLYVDPVRIAPTLHAEVAEKVSQLLAEETLRAHLVEQLEKKSRSRRVTMWLPLSQKEAIEKWWYPFAKRKKIASNALYFVKDYQRSYPFGKMLGQVLHTVRDLRDEVTGQSIPTGGLEQEFNHVLQGKAGKRLFLRSPYHAIEGGKVIEAPQDGADVYLTIDLPLQAIAEQEIEEQVKKTEAKRGWAVMIDPYTGDVLALAQYPFFSPKEYRTFYNDPQKEEEVDIKAITDPFEPGSTMKAITATVGLLANAERKRQGLPPIFDPEAKVETAPTHFPGRKTPIKDISIRRYMNMDMALQKSSNVYMAKLVDKVIRTMGEEWYRDVLEKVFGFGVKTGIELPAESAGLLPRPGKLHPNGTLEWSRPTPYSLAMGHNILVNSLQMVRAFALIANGGYEIPIGIVDKVARKLPSGKEEVLFCRSRVESHRQLIPTAITEQVVHGLKYVTKEGGAARKGDIYGFTEAGKTSTSEKIVEGKYDKKTHISTFIGFAPAHHPRFVLMVVIDEPACKSLPEGGRNQLGGNCAAPCFRRIGLRALQYLGVEPDDPFGYPVGDPRRDPERADWNQEMKQLNQLCQEWNR